MNKYAQEICDFWKKYQARFVKVNEEKVKTTAKKISKSRLSVPDWQIDGILPKSNSAFASQIFYICAVDFAFTHFEAPHEKYRLTDDISGSNAASACFYRHFGEKPVTVKTMLEIASSLEKTKNFFQGVNLPPLVEKRRENLWEAANVIKVIFAGNPLNILKETEFTVTKIIDVLITMFPKSFGSDVYRAPFDGKKQRLLFANKRAQLWPLIYQGRATHSSSQLTPLKDPENIGPVADYQIPKYLRAEGVLEYLPELDDKINKQNILPYGSLEEMEIRWATIYVVCKLLKKTNLTMPELDYFLWTEGRKIKNLKHHLTPTTAY